MSISLYDFKFRYDFIKGEKVKWNKKIFKKCPFEVDEVKIVDDIRKETKDFVGVKGIRMWWNWWEIVPTSLIKKPIYWIKFYMWYWIRYIKLQKEIDKIE